MVGSPTDEYNFRLNLFYASACCPTSAEGGVVGTGAYQAGLGADTSAVTTAYSNNNNASMDFRFAVVFPEDGRWSFPSTLDENSLAEAKKMALGQAVAQMVAWKPDVIHSHLLCVKGQTTYRYASG